eukprot:TRINITY_DN279_c0_g1_i1.p1 TRINITY_DN279_c0_g1~~TRINITY_DN279_c0_g1_i1.p1  ORF type:complete len:1093 (+),score=229.45 TRINITY_DN279_c0_g1_i1:45-3323(+)
MATPQQVEFENLIKLLLSPDNDKRGHAEQLFNDNKQYPEQLLLALLTAATQSADTDVKKTSCVLFRKLINRGDTSLWPKISLDVQRALKEKLLYSLESEPDAAIRKQIGNIVSELAVGIFSKVYDGDWPELLGGLFKFISSDSESHQENALQIFSQLIFFCWDKFKVYIGELKRIFANAFTRSFEVRVAALQALVNTLEVCENTFYAQFTDVNPLILKTLEELLRNNKQTEARAYLELLVELMGSVTVFFRPYIEQYFAAMMSIINTEQFEEEVRNTALEFLISLAEIKPALARKIPNFTASVTPSLLKMMMTLTENPDWNQGEKADITDDQRDIGEESLDRLSIALGGNTLAPILFNTLPQLLSNEDWRQRYAALMAISVVGEGCVKYLTPYLDKVLAMVLPKFQDPHPRVRWAACNTTGQMSTDFGGPLQEKFSADILNGLMFLMQDTQNPRVQSHAASAIVNFCEHCETEILKPYLPALMEKLMALVSLPNQLITEQAVTAVAAIADCVEDQFTPYYDGFVPYLKTIISHANTPDLLVLRGKALECISIIGVAVGKQKFAQDGLEIMKHLLHNAPQTETDDQVSFTLQAWARFCKCLGSDFVPFLGMVMPSLLKSAAIEPQFKQSEVDDDDDDEYEEGWETLSVGGKKLQIRSSALEEKTTACNMLYCYSEELKEGFFPHVPAVMNICAPLVNFLYSDDVRAAVVTLMPSLMRSASHYFTKSGQDGKAALAQLWLTCFPHFIEALPDEVDIDLLQSMVDSFRECLEIAGENVLNPEQLSKTVDVIKSIIVEYSERMRERNERSGDQDLDSEETERLQDEHDQEEELLLDIADLSGKLVKLYRGIFLSAFQTGGVLPLFIQMLDPKAPPHERQVGLCVFDDIIEYTPAESMAYYEVFLPAMVNYIGDSHPGVRQAAAYGIGVVAVHAGPRFINHINPSLEALFRVVSLPDANSEENIHAKENGVSAIGKIIRHNPDKIDVPRILPMWVGLLPVLEDKIESQVVYDNLLFFLETPPFQQLLFGANPELNKKILSIFGDILATDLINDSHKGRILRLLSAWHALCPVPLSQAFESLTPDQKAKLQNAQNPAQ